jgi:nucleoside 2-deoxyribosyltransferase
MNIFFSGSIRGGRGHQHLYPNIVSELEKHGTVFSKHISEESVSEYGETALSAEDIYERECAALQGSDIVVADVSVPSLGVGYVIAKAKEWGKPVIALHHGEDTLKLSALIKGDSNVRVYTYEEEEEIASLLQQAFKN